MTKPRARYMFKSSTKDCEFCGKSINSQSEFTVCGTCDAQLEMKFRAEDARKAKAWASKYKCRQCGKGLPVTRWFNCETCIDPWHMPTECEFESHETFNIGDVEVVKAAYRKEAKECGNSRSTSAVKR